jgi:hypothetical protein
VCVRPHQHEADSACSGVAMFGMLKCVAGRNLRMIGDRDENNN